ncbi:hypothetical protein DICSQDRAFT_141794 [Dichomitus squalens LYAD-421 SS1]|uniref:DUF6534 domain-containing protein n=1 Tax=Dichomitus squalens (strain LYAD-421) TaxID=732165 RepID=R7SIT5_DICSQ|nr:uncharacterized protein DICSQDRAFT_141794 [Dichomitus squalens LYAD-421 SS1]EJF55763.1 hypothetical protein DICSQDRAFT_141794 [Dichomitus squalens LYAD-421 SS1]
MGSLSAAAEFADKFFGGLLVEVLIACVLYGVTTLQTFIYFQKYPNDSPYVKLFVAAVWILETVHTAFCIHVVYGYLILNFADVENFGKIYWSIGITVMTEVVLSTMVQSFYVRRVWIMSNSRRLLTGGIAFCVVCRIAFGIGSTVLSYRFREWSAFRAQKSSLVTVSGGLGAAALVDVLVALTLSWYLSRGRSDFPQVSKSRVNLIMLYAVNSGAITAAASVLSVILYATQSKSLVFLGIVEIQGKLYANSFLGSLNARAHIRSKNNPVQYPSFESYSNNGFRAPPVPKVEVFQQTMVTTDLGLHNVGHELENVSATPRSRSSSVSRLLRTQSADGHGIAV